MGRNINNTKITKNYIKYNCKKHVVKHRHAKILHIHLIFKDIYAGFAMQNRFRNISKLLLLISTIYMPLVFVAFVLVRSSALRTNESGLSYEPSYALDKRFGNRYRHSDSPHRSGLLA